MVEGRGDRHPGRHQASAAHLHRVPADHPPLPAGRDGRGGVRGDGDRRVRIAAAPVRSVVAARLLPGGGPDRIRRRDGESVPARHAHQAGGQRRQRAAAVAGRRRRDRDTGACRRGVAAPGRPHLRGADGLRPDRAAHLAYQLGSSLGVGRPRTRGAHRRRRPDTWLGARGLASRSRRDRRRVRCLAALLVGRRHAASGRAHLVCAADGLRHRGRSEVRRIPLARPAAHRREPLSSRRRGVLAGRAGRCGAGAPGRAAAAGQLHAYRGAGR